MKRTTKTADDLLKAYAAPPARDVNSVVRAVIKDLAGPAALPGPDTSTLSSLGITKEQLPQLADALTAAFGSTSTARLRLHRKLTPAAIAESLAKEDA